MRDVALDHAIASRWSRRRFVAGCALGATALAAPGAFAQTLRPTPAMTEGPFYPDRLPLDSDSDLVSVDGASASAAGEVTWLSGRILGSDGRPLSAVLVEIWQVDRNGVYLHRGSDNAGRRDRNFQGYGRYQTNAAGEYLFRTIRPVTYSGRAPHVHFAVTPYGGGKFTTQCFVAGAPENDGDFLLRRITDARARASLIVPFEPIPRRSGELSARFDVVLGTTPSD